MYETTLQHLIAMALDPAWRAHAKLRAETLNADSSGLFTGILEDVRSGLQERRSEQQHSSNGRLHD